MNDLTKIILIERAAENAHMFEDFLEDTREFDISYLNIQNNIKLKIIKLYIPFHAKRFSRDVYKYLTVDYEIEDVLHMIYPVDKHYSFLLAVSEVKKSFIELYWDIIEDENLDAHVKYLKELERDEEERLMTEPSEQSTMIFLDIQERIRSIKEH